MESKASLFRRSRPERKRRGNGGRIAVTGLGCCSAAGPDLPSGLHNLGRVCCRTDRADLFAPGPCAPVFAVDGPHLAQTAFAPWGAPPETGGRTAVLALTAIVEALSRAALTPDHLVGKRVGVALGTTVGCSFLHEAYYKNWKEGRPQDDAPVYDFLASNLAEQIQRILRLTGPRMVITNACASGTDAIGLARTWLRNELCDLAIAGGADALSRVACHGFSSLMLVSPRPCRPFDAARDGLTLGEGAGILIMEREESARSRHAGICGWVRGYGSASDAHHPTAPHPEGRGLQEAVREAIRDAGVTLADIGYINAHGTGTPANDLAELTALARLGFAARRDCPIVSTKGATGHTLGAAGGIEAVLTLCALNAGTTPGNTGCAVVDAALPFAVPTATEHPRLSGRIGMSESLAFGGGNAAIILEGNDA